MTSRDGETAAPPATRTRRGRRVALLTIVALLVLVAFAAYWAEGSRRVGAACGREDVAPEGASSWESDWSWLPPGFTCTYEDGTVLRSFWW